MLLLSSMFYNDTIPIIIDGYLHMLVYLHHLLTYLPSHI